MKKRTTWVEVWIDSASRGDYLLMLRALEDGSLEVIDLQKGKEVVRTFASYEAAVHWLSEDEYDRVEGRWVANG